MKPQDVKEPGHRVEADEFSPVPPPYRPRKRYVWPLVFGSIGVSLGLLHGLASLPRHKGEGSGFLIGYFVGSVAV
jgi:hypothetical protein